MTWWRHTQQPDLRLWLWALLWVLCIPQVTLSELNPCPFNNMCRCKYAQEGTNAALSAGPTVSDLITEVVCAGVPFARLPAIPPGLLLHLDVMNSGIETISNGDMVDVQVESLRVMNSNLRSIGEKALIGMAHNLRSLDLSNNELCKVPRDSLRPLKTLEWISLSGNNIVELSQMDWAAQRDTLISVYLGTNDIDNVPRDVFSNWDRLVWLDLKKNNILSLPSNSLSRTIRTLDLNHNLLTGFPAEAVSNIDHLSWLFLRGNLIDRLPDTGFRYPKVLDTLDFGENFIQFIPNNLFNGSLTARDLYLDFNLLTEIQEEAFKDVNPGRLFLTANNIYNISEQAFLGGPEHSLILINIEKNRLEEIPKALSYLKKLRYFHIHDNKISKIKDEAFQPICDTLASLGLSGNQLKAIPRTSLENCTSIFHLNIGYNQITEINEEDFAMWGDSLSTLILRGNKLYSLPPHVFRFTPKLRELSLSFNRIVDIYPDSFIDVLNTLEILEISFGFYRDEFPEQILKPLTSLTWIALDNNNIRTISETALFSFGKLRYFNMESNRLIHIPKTLFHQNVHKELLDIRIGLNFLERLEVHTFHNLEKLRTVVLTGNRVSTVHFEAFKTLPSLKTILLANNNLRKIEARAFCDLPSLAELQLQHNNLIILNMSSFFNVSQNSTLSFNISSNKIEEINIASAASPQVKTFDASHNEMKEVPLNFLQSIKFHLESFNIGYNLINTLDSSAFGDLDRLQMLILEHNRIQLIRPKAFLPLSNVQVLDLNHNHLVQLPHECFTDTSSLRVLDLSHNHLRSLPNSVFRGTQLETIRLSHNEFASMPTASFSKVENTLYSLDISHNHIEHLDSTMFYSFPKLIELNLASNILSILPDNVFVSLPNLINLDLSGNPVRANFKELFHYTQNVQTLNLARIGFSSSPIIPLPNLAKLNLSSNSISEIELQSMESLHALRSLDLSHNNLTGVRQHLWRNMPFLKYLDLSFNPIDALTKLSFGGASRIETLVLRNLDVIRRFDYDALSHMTFLKELYMNTYPGIEKYKFRVGHLLATVHTLQKLHLEVRETELTDQIMGAFGPKLNELHITGKNLRTIDSKTFKGFQNRHQLQLSITDTSIQSLPDGLLTHVSDVAYLSLDLRRNRLKFLNPHVLYQNGSDWESKGTLFVRGGIALEGNDWTCECSLVWLGRWLRRWLRETLQIHTAMVKGAQEVQSKVRAATCFDPRSGKQLPLLDLHSEELGCHASALSDSGHAPPTTRPSFVAIILGLFLLLSPTFSQFLDS